MTTDTGYLFMFRQIYVAKIIFLFRNTYSDAAWHAGGRAYIQANQ